jgi:SAM-dependent methyltransferase
MKQSRRRSERTYYDTFFASSECGGLDDGTGFRSLRQAQADYLCHKMRSFADAGVVLSVGCGNGEIEMLLDGTRWRVFAFDLSFAGLAAGSHRAAQRNLTHLSFGQAALPGLPISSRSCDVVLALSILHHLRPPKRAEALYEIHRVLRDGGWFIAYDPSKWRVLRLAKFLVRKKYDALHSPDEEELDPRQMQRLAQSVGFEQVWIEFFDIFIDPLTWLFPNMPPGLFKMLYKLDRALVHSPGKQLASNFFLVGHKPFALRA